jgi:glutaredoxin
MAATFSLVLYGRPGCHLCEDAREVLERVGAPFREVNIETDDALHARLLERIPVVVLDGEELFEYFVDEQTLRARLSGLSDHVE